MNNKRILSVILACLMAASSFVACSDAENNDEKDTSKQQSGSESDAQSDAESEETEAADPFADVDFNDRSFRINTSSHQTETTLATSNIYIEGPDGYAGERAQDAAYDRNNKVEELLGVKLIYTPQDTNYDEVADVIRTYMMAQDNTYELFINDMYGAAPLCLEGMFRPASDFTAFDLTQNYWYGEFMSDIAINNQYQYMLAGDYFIDVLRSSHGLVFNKNLYTTLYGNSDDLYQTVIDGKWTYEQFMTLVETSYNDENGDGEKNYGDRFGYVSDSIWGPSIPFMVSANPGYIERDEEGWPVITVYNENTIKLVEYLTSFFKGDGTATEDVFTGGLSATEAFMQGQSIFIGSQRLGSLEYSGFRDMDYEIGIVPYPKMTEEGRYITSVHDTTEVGLVPILVPNGDLEFVGTVIEVLNRETNTMVLPEYYEYLLKNKYSSDPTAAKMIDIIHDNITNSFVLAWSFALNKIFMPPIYYAVIGNGDYTSQYQSRIEGAESLLSEIIEAHS